QRVHLQPDLRLAGRRDDRTFLFLARRPRDGYGRRAQCGPCRDPRRTGGSPRAGRQPRPRGDGAGQADEAGGSRTDEAGGAWRMSGLMNGKRGLIMGLANDKSLAWGIAQKLREHGAELAFSYQGEALGKRVKPLAEQLGSDFTFECDVSDMAALDAAFAGLKKRWETIDFIVHAIGFSDKNE